MYRNIYSFIISLLMITCMSANAQVKTETKKSTPLINGIYIEADLASAVDVFLEKGKKYDAEAAIKTRMYKNYFPVLELGLGGADITTNSGMTFHTRAPFYRLGVDINLLKQKDEKKPKFDNLFLAGLRLGMSNMRYDIYDITIDNSYWGNDITYNRTDLISNKLWYEITAGIRVKFWRQLYTGWTLRKKTMISTDEAGALKTLYIPGYGMNEEGQWAFDYVVGIQF